jgi:hypothetical protein
MDPTSVPLELYLRTNIAPVVEVAGNVYPELTGVLFRAKLLIWVVAVETYCPVTYIFPDESVVIPYPISLPLPSRIMDPVSVPPELYLSMKVALPVVAGNVYPELTGVLLRAKLLIWVVAVETYCPVTYMFPLVSTVIPYPKSLLVPSSIPNKLG